MEKIESQKVIELYSSGLSIQQISELLRISVSKIRYFMRSQSICCRNRSEASRLLHITKFGRKQFQIKENLSEKEEILRVAGIMLYWGEGTKSGNSVVFSNSDPQMVILFLKFLRVICQVDEKRLRMLLHMYDDQSEIQLKNFWSRATVIPIEQFSKTFIHQKKIGTYKKISQYGTVSLRYSDKQLLRTINLWIGKFRMPA